MSITDELKAWWVRKFPIMDKELHEEFTAIADRIDAEHEKATAGCIHYDPERHYCAVHGDTENGWVRLPKDADGVPIRVGDVVERADDPDVSRVVSIIQLADDGWWVYVGGTGMRPDKYRHHHEPTVEEVLEDMIAEAADCDTAELVERYSKLLALRGE